jgi:peptide subunit release factor 1 (eRF1)
MKVSLHIPTGKKGMRKFVASELAQATNIQDKTTRKQVMSGLKKILTSIHDATSGVSIYTDGTEIQI